jgi:low affinity Fe/Cu permease
MVFIIQNTQNRDCAAVQAKLDELIRVSAAQNALIGIEHLTQDEISDIADKCLARGRQRKANKKAGDAVRVVAFHNAPNALAELWRREPLLPLDPTSI